MPTAPIAILPAASEASAPDDPVVILAEIGAGSAPASPAVALGAAGSGSAPDDPLVILSEIGDGSPPSSPVVALSVFIPSSGVTAFAFAQASAPTRDGRYVFLGTSEEGDPIWGREGDLLDLSDGILSGSGLVFRQRDLGGDFVWALEYSEDFVGTSPDQLFDTAPAPASTSRDEYPTPWSAAAIYFDPYEEGVPAATFEPEGVSVTSPETILPPATGGAAPDNPDTILASITGATAPTSPQPILGVPLHGVYDTDGVPLTDTDGAILTN